jgi:dynein heavy chain 1
LFLKEVFDEEFVAIPELDLVKVVQEETNCKSPILFCSAPGFDASSKIEALARSLNKKFLSIAIGSSEGFELVEKKFPKQNKIRRMARFKKCSFSSKLVERTRKKIIFKRPKCKFQTFLDNGIQPKNSRKRFKNFQKIRI